MENVELWNSSFSMSGVFSDFIFKNTKRKKKNKLRKLNIYCISLASKRIFFKFERKQLTSFF